MEGQVCSIGTTGEAKILITVSTGIEYLPTHNENKKMVKGAKSRSTAAIFGLFHLLLAVFCIPNTFHVFNSVSSIAV
jgi:hypothetical protein